MTDYQHILVERDGPVGTVWLNRPERMNALYTPVFEEFLDAIDGLAKDPEVRVVVISGKGRGFCAGGDIQLDVSQVGRWDATTTIYENEIGHRMVLDLIEMPKPVIARVNGPAVGGGCDLALACDIVIASEDAGFGEFWIRRGLTPAMGGAYFLPRLVGTHLAKQILFTGELVSATRAAEIGMINAVVPAEELDRAVAEMATRLAAMPTLAVRQVKKMVEASFDVTLADHLETTTHTAFFLSKTEDYAEGVAAFEERREPSFKGR